jgi:hypothetical protein
VLVGYLKVLAIQALDPPYSAEREGETVAARSSPMSLSGERGGRGGAGRLNEARGGSGEANVRLGEM